MPPSVAELDLDEFDRVVRINVWGVLAGIKHATRVMIPVSFRCNLCTTRVSGLMVGPEPHPYKKSKFITGVVKSVTSEL